MFLSIYFLFYPVKGYEHAKLL